MSIFTFRLLKKRVYIHIQLTKRTCLISWESIKLIWLRLCRFYLFIEVLVVKVNVAYTETKAFKKTPLAPLIVYNSYKWFLYTLQYKNPPFPSEFTEWWLLLNILTVTHDIDKKVVVKFRTTNTPLDTHGLGVSELQQTHTKLTVHIYVYGHAHASVKQVLTSNYFCKC